MLLMAVRHGDAGDSIEGDNAADDARPLTELGVEQVEKIAARLAQDENVPAFIYASPTVRTRQSAMRMRAVFAKAGFPVPPVRFEDGLGPSDEHRGHSLSAVVQKLAKDEKLRRVMIVSHHDALFKGLAALNDVDAMSVPVLAKGEVRGLRVDRETGEWEERWALLPSDVGLEDIYGEVDY